MTTHLCRQRTPARSGGEPHQGPLSQEWRGAPTSTDSETQPGVAGNRTQEPPPGVERDQPRHTPTTPTATPAANPSRPQPHTHTQTHTHQHTRKAKPHQHHHHEHTTHSPAQTPRVHAPRHKHTHHEKPPTQPHGNGHRHGRRTPARSGGEPQPGPRPRWQATTHHRRQRTPARSGTGPQPGPSPRSGEEHPPSPAAKPSQEWRENARRNLCHEWRGTAHNKPQPGKQTAHTPHMLQHTRRTQPGPHHCHKHTTHTLARAAPQTRATQSTTAASGPQPGLAGTAPRTLSQEWQGATHHQHQRAPCQEWRGTAPGALSQE